MTDIATTALGNLRGAPDRPLLPVYVPVEDTGQRTLTIATGSGIIGSPGGWWSQLMDPGYLMVDFEGNIYGASNIRTYADRVYHAYDRHLSRYPTLARYAVKEDELVQIGMFDGDEVYLTSTGKVHLERWLGREVQGADLRRS